MVEKKVTKEKAEKHIKKYKTSSYYFDGKNYFITIPPFTKEEKKEWKYFKNWDGF